MQSGEVETAPKKKVKNKWVRRAQATSSRSSRSGWANSKDCGTKCDKQANVFSFYQQKKHKCGSRLSFFGYLTFYVLVTASSVGGFLTPDILYGDKHFTQTFRLSTVHQRHRCYCVALRNAIIPMPNMNRLVCGTETEKSLNSQFFKCINLKK